MHYELVDEVDGLQKCAKDTLLRSVKDAAEFKRQAAFSACMSIVRLHKLRHWKDQYMTKVKEIELEQKHFADELEKSRDKISNQADVIESLEYELAAAVEDSVVCLSNLCSTSITFICL